MRGRVPTRGSFFGGSRINVNTSLHIMQVHEKPADAIIDSQINEHTFLLEELDEKDLRKYAELVNQLKSTRLLAECLLQIDIRNNETKLTRISMTREARQVYDARQINKIIAVIGGNYYYAEPKDVTLDLMALSRIDTIFTEIDKVKEQQSTKSCCSIS